jgi:hypothetical protein
MANATKMLMRELVLLLLWMIVDQSAVLCSSFTVSAAATAAAAYKILFYGFDFEQEYRRKMDEQNCGQHTNLATPNFVT